MIITKLIILALLILTFFIVSYVIIFREVPMSFSNIYYKLKKYGWLLQVMLFSIAIITLISWLDLTKNSSTQFLAFLSPMAIMFVALTPKFKPNKNSSEDEIHLIAAIVAFSLSLIWTLIISKSYVIFGLMGAISLLSYRLWPMDSDGKDTKIFWGEILGFYSLLITLLIESFKHL